MSASNFVEVLRRQREEILKGFIAEVERKNLAPKEVPRSLIVDHVPRFLDEMIREIERGAAGGNLSERETGATAREHGEQRWSIGYDLEALVREYDALRTAILGIAKASSVSISIDEFTALSKCLGVGVSEAVAEYIKERDREVRARRADLELLAEAGRVLSSSLDYGSTLRRLMELLVPRMADWCVVHQQQNGHDVTPVAHVDPAKLQLVRDLYARYPGSAGDGYEEVLRSGEPRLLADVGPELVHGGARSEEHRAWLEALGTRSLIVVPLRVQGVISGALTLAYSDSGRRYGEADSVLATEVAQRAAVAIENAKLYELSQSARSRVEAATRAKDEFVAAVSHELRTPLHAILGWLRIMRTGSLDEGRKAHAFDVIERNAEAQSQLVADLLDISRVITGKIRINPSQLDLGSIIELAIESVRLAADAKRIRIEVAIERESTVIRGDGGRLQQVVWNLLANAIKFTPKNGLVRVALRRVESEVEIEVEDYGEGIAPEFLPYVFESFRQGEAGLTRPHGGLGIGLSIAKHIVELHGGSIQARSAGKGSGATFCVRLPISPLVSTTMGVSRVPAMKSQAEVAFDAGGLEGVRVLVVDDEPDARELVVYVLESCGADVRAVGSAAEAMAELTRFRPLVVLSDVGMPDEDGYLLIRTIRTLPDETLRRTPAIALTAFARAEDRTRALVEGFNQHMAKPVEPGALVRAVLDLTKDGR